MSIEAMRQALEALEEINELSRGPSAICLPAEIDTAMDALQQAIEFEEMVKKGTKAWDGTPDDWVDDLRGGAEKRESKPYDPMERNADYERGFIDGRADQMKSSVDRAVNKMAQREWVGLTDEEIKEIVGPWGETLIKGYTRKLFDQIEAKLKEKNS